MIDRDRLVGTLLELVRIDSPSGEEEAVAREVAGWLGALGFAVRRDGYGNVVARRGGERAGALVLSAHLDTVEPGRGVSPRVEGGRVVSDGSTVLGGDCKAGIAAILEALRSLEADGVATPQVEVVLNREEEMGLVGAKRLDFSLVEGRQAVVFDTGGPVERFVSASPTYVSFDVRLTGRAAHAGTEPEKGLSAMRPAAELVQALPQGRLDEMTTFNVGQFQAGSVRNAVPERAVLKGEFRSRGDAAVEGLRGTVEREVGNLRSRWPEVAVELAFTREFEGYALEGAEPVLERARRALGVVGGEPDPAPTGGGTDANIFRQHGIESLVVGMGCRDAHTTRESVEISWLVDTARFCEALLRPSPA